MKLRKQHICGSARLRVVKQDVEMIGAVDPSDVGEFDRVRGMKRYELSNHLGNVLTVISDRKIATVDNGVNIYYHAEIISYTDYYPFGAPMSQGTTDRTWSAEEYRFGFNGMESVDEMIGESNGYDFGARMYDARLGRWWSLDPKSGQNATWSPFANVLNNPIVFQDVKGEWPGITFFFGEIDAGAGLSYGINYVEQTGVAYDDVGTTRFVMTNALYILNQQLDKGSTDPQLIIGLSISLTVNMKQNWSAETFGGLVSKGGIGLPIPFGADLGAGVAANIGFNSDEFVFGVGLGIGAKINFINTTIKESISLTEDETKVVENSTDVVFESWSVSDAIPQKNKAGQVTGYSANVTTTNSRGEVIDTGITVYSQVTKDAKGNEITSGVWSSASYKMQSGMAEKK